MSLGEQELPGLFRLHAMASGSTRAILVDSDSRLMLNAGIAARLTPRALPVLSLDTILPATEQTPRAKRWLFRFAVAGISHHLGVFRDCGGYAREYGLDPSRWRYIGFKANVWERRDALRERRSDDGYVFVFGRSYRDIPFFLSVARLSPNVRYLWLHPPMLELAAHGTRQVRSSGDLPANVKAVEDLSGEESVVDEHLLRASALFLPIADGIVSAAGISTYLSAMALGIPVIITECPAARGLVDNGTALVVTHDVSQAAKAITSMMGHLERRDSFAAAGLRHANSLGGTEQYLTRVRDACHDFLGSGG